MSFLKLFIYIWRVNWRWYFTGLIIALAFFGISREQSAVPNQEIVIQFDAHSVSTDEAQRAISEITAQLKSIGVADVQISEILDGKLKVTYYSTIDVAVIKNLFQKQDKLQLGDTAFNEKDDSSKIPFSNNSNTYKLDVIKIQKDYGSDIALRGLLVEVKSVKDQYLITFSPLNSSENNFDFQRCIVNVVCKNYQNVILLSDKTSHKIPEVRAGPLS
ncbi:MAG: hypothetical protein JJE55_05400 [Flavobacteriaceae bacterium]|nr:hypothetical protein [Flavobacteriaceae bacterium]